MSFFPPDRTDAGKFVVRSYDVGDGRALQEAVVSSYDHLKTYMLWAKPNQTPEDAEASVRRFRANYLLGDDYPLGIWSPDESELWGGTGFHLRDGPAEWLNAEIGMWIRASHAHQGLGTDVLRHLVSWGFTDWQWERLTWHCDPDNQASLRVAEKAGLEREALLRSQQVRGDGQRRDTVRYVTLRPSPKS